MLTPVTTLCTQKVIYKMSYKCQKKIEITERVMNLFQITFGIDIKLGDWQALIQLMQKPNI